LGIDALKGMFGHVHVGPDLTPALAEKHVNRAVLADVHVA
jgi:hypothetical protein